MNIWTELQTPSSAGIGRHFYASSLFFAFGSKTTLAWAKVASLFFARLKLKMTVKVIFTAAPSF